MPFLVIFFVFQFYRYCENKEFWDWRDTSITALVVAGFNHARTITKASAKGLDAIQDDHTKGTCSPGSLINNPDI